MVTVIKILTARVLRNIRYNSNRASIAKIHRSVYERKYSNLMVFEDGSTITIRYHEPLSIITLPLDVSKLSEEERKLQLEKRKPKPKVIIEEEIEDDFDLKRYLKYRKHD